MFRDRSRTTRLILLKQKSAVTTKVILFYSKYVPPLGVSAQASGKQQPERPTNDDDRDDLRGFRLGAACRGLVAAFCRSLTSLCKDLLSAAISYFGNRKQLLAAKSGKYGERASEGAYLFSSQELKGRFLTRSFSREQLSTRYLVVHGPRVMCLISKSSLQSRKLTCAGTEA